MASIHARWVCGALLGGGLIFLAAPALPQAAASSLIAQAAAGDAKAQSQLAQAYLLGIQGVQKDDVQAAQWARKAADQGDADGEAMLAGLYLDGIGVAKDETMAIALTERAMAQKNGAAFYLGARMARERTRVPDHDQRANTLLRIGAYLGNRASMAALGEVFDKGLGVTPDPVQAYVWYGVAVVQFDPSHIPPELAGALRAIKVTPQQEKSAQALVAKCVDSDLRDCGQPELSPALVK